MNPQFQQSRPPYFEFEQRAVEHRTPEGVASYTMVDYMIITPAGSKDKIEREVTSYFKNLQHLTTEGMFPPAWLTDYKAAYDSWKETNSFEMKGTPIRNWPALTPGEVKIILQANIRTVEDLAEANEASLARIGMGARSMQARARDWITASKDTAPILQQMDAMRVTNDGLVKRLEALAKQNETLLAQLAAPRQAQEQPAVNMAAFVPRSSTSAESADNSLIDEALS